MREFKGRLQVLETHFHQPGGKVDEWVAEADALPPVEVSDPVTGLQEDVVSELDDPVPEDEETEDEE